MTKRARKAERMEARRAIGQRKPKPPPAPRRGAVYLVAHACFACRRSTKRPPSERPLACSRCGATVYEMGRSFRAPARDDLEEWLKVQTLYACGFRFAGARRSAARLPEHLRDVAAFLRQHPEHPLRVAPPLVELLPARRKAR